MKEVVRNLEERFKKQGNKLPAREKTPMSSDYIPKLDVTAEMYTNNITRFQELIGDLRWFT